MAHNTRTATKKYCKCQNMLILANLETGEGECIACKLPKKLNKRLKEMSKGFKDGTK